MPNDHIPREQDRGFTDEHRVSAAESGRNDAEHFRRLAEEAREVRDQHREALETVRKERELLREAGEVARTASEEARTAAEAARLAASLIGATPNPPLTRTAERGPAAMSNPCPSGPRQLTRSP